MSDDNAVIEFTYSRTGQLQCPRLSVEFNNG